MLFKVQTTQRPDENAYYYALLQEAMALQAQHMDGKGDAYYYVLLQMAANGTVFYYYAPSEQKETGASPYYSGYYYSYESPTVTGALEATGEPGSEHGL